MELQRSPHDTVAAVLITALGAVDPSVDHELIRMRVDGHPSPLSLLAISEIAEGLGFEARGVQGDAAALPELDLPAIAGVERDGTPAFTVILERGEGTLALGDPVDGFLRARTEDVEPSLTGTFVLLAQKHGPRLSSSERLRLLVRKLRPTPTRLVRAAALALAAFAIAGVASLDPATAPSVALLTALMALGAAVCGLMTAFVLAGRRFHVSSGRAEQGRAAALVASMCSFGERLSCGDVLLSPQSTVLGVSYAYLGVGYFLGAFGAVGTACIIGASASPVLLALVLPLSAAGVLLAAYLTYVQARVVRAWCPWCMVAHAVNAALLVASVTLVWSGGFVSADAARPLVPVAAVWGLSGAVLVLLLLREEDRLLFARQTQDLRNMRTGMPTVRLEHERRVRRVFPAEAGSAPWGLGGGVEVEVFAALSCPGCLALDRALSKLFRGVDEGRLVVRLVTPPPEDPEGLLTSRRPCERAGLSLLAYAAGVAKGAEAYRSAVSLLLATGGDHFASTGAEVLAALGLSTADVEPHLTEAARRLAEDAALAIENGLKHTPAVFVEGKPLPVWATHGDKLKLIAGRLERARVAKAGARARERARRRALMSARIAEKHQARGEQ